MSCGHRVVGITNGHSIHTGPCKGTGVSIYWMLQSLLSPWLRKSEPSIFPKVVSHENWDRSRSMETIGWGPSRYDSCLEDKNEWFGRRPHTCQNSLFITTFGTPR